MKCKLISLIVLADLTLFSGLARAQKNVSVFSISPTALSQRELDIATANGPQKSAVASAIRAGASPAATGLAPTPMQKVLRAQLQVLGGVAGGGGDEDGIDFQRAAFEAIESFKTLMPNEYMSLQNYGIAKVPANTKIIVVDDKLYVSIDGFSQESLAINFPDLNTIVVNRMRWRGLTEHKKRLGIVLHEVFSLKHIESSGSYNISAKYMNQLGISQDVVQELRTPVINKTGFNLSSFIAGSYVRDRGGEGAYYNCKMRIGTIPTSNAATITFSSCSGYGIYRGDQMDSDTTSISVSCSAYGSMGPFCFGTLPAVKEQSNMWGSKKFVPTSEIVVFTFDEQKNAVLTFYDANGERLNKSLAFLK
jgi:hypothetical protein